MENKRKIFLNACINGDFPLVSKLYTPYHNILSCAADGLRLAIQYGHLDIVDYIFCLGFGADYTKDECLIDSVTYQQTKIVQYLTKIGCDPRGRHGRAFNVCASTGNVEIFQHLLKIGPNPKNGFDPALRAASAHGHIEMVKYLIGLGCDPMSSQGYCIVHSAKNKHYDVAKYLIALTSDFDANYYALEYCLATVYMDYNFYRYLLSMFSKRLRLKYLSKIYKINYWIANNWMSFSYIRLTSKNLLRKHNMLKTILKPTSLRIQMTYF
jgi:hypothetical protein